MSNETLNWLNTMTLIGNTDNRGHAWHYRAELQGDEANHYAGAVPVEDIRRRLIPWHAVPRRVAVELPADPETVTHLGENGELLRWAVMEERQAMTRSDTHHVFQVFKNGYQPHQYDQWLIGNVENILDDTLQVSSAGLLRGGGVMWVEVSIPETITTPEGVAFKPNLLSATSFDGTLATTHKRTIQAVVCDNTLEIANAERGGGQIKIRHSKNSIGRITDVRAALNIVHTAAEDFMAEVAALTQQKVTDQQWGELLEQLVPMDDDDSARKLAGANIKRGQLDELYRNDPRAADWTGTAYGVLATFNTWSHHLQGGLSGTNAAEKGAARAQRNMLRAVQGTQATEDQRVLDALAGVLG